MKNKEKSNLSWDRVLNIVALTAGIVALFFSWQANQIAREANEIAFQQVNAQVAILASEFNGGGFSYNDQEGHYEVRCGQIIRVSNLGGASTSIVSYDAGVYYKGAELLTSSERPFAYPTETLATQMHDFQFVFVKQLALRDLPDTTWVTDEYYLPFPVQIGSFTSIDIHSVLSFLLDGVRQTGEIDVPYREYELDKPQSKYDLSPIEVAYTLRTDSGQVLKTARILCLYLK